MKGDFAVAEAN